MTLTSILDVVMRCPLCKTLSRLGDCENDADEDGSFGCPIADCGGIVTEEITS